MPRGILANLTISHIDCVTNSCDIVDEILKTNIFVTIYFLKSPNDNPQYGGGVAHE